MRRGWYFAFWQDWSEWFTGTCNWYEFTLINAHAEYYNYKGRGIEVRLGLLGLNVEIEYCWQSWDYEDVEPVNEQAG